MWNIILHLHKLILDDTKASGAQVFFIFHPVRGEYQVMYPGNDVVDMLGLSIFNSDLCMPGFSVSPTSHYEYNGSGITGTTPTKFVSDFKCVSGGVGYDQDVNILGAVAFAKANGKPVILSETSPQNFVDRFTNNSFDSPGFKWEDAT